MQDKNTCPACTQRAKHREDAEYRDLLSRLNRIEGQVRGVKKMVEEDRYCIDIINQTSAVIAALNSFNKVLLSAHIKTCVTEDILSGSSRLTDELCDTLKKLMR
ncbi:MAG: metal-sensing transcriptional repressor [Emergencia sp.]